MFKGFVSRAKKLCSEIYLDEELNFLVNMFVEKGLVENYLNSIIKINKYQESKIGRLPPPQKRFLP